MVYKSESLRLAQRKSEPVERPVQRYGTESRVDGELPSCRAASTGCHSQRRRSGYSACRSQSAAYLAI